MYKFIIIKADRKMKIKSIRKIGITGGTIFFLGLLSHVLFPCIINQQVETVIVTQYSHLLKNLRYLVTDFFFFFLKKLRLEKGKLRRFIWDKPPFFFTVKFYLFNVTNPEEVMNGEKPILNEIGPFAYEYVVFC